MRSNPAWDSVRTPTELQAGAELVARLRAKILAEPGARDNPGEAYTRGLLHTFAWVLGTTATSPLLGRTSTSTPDPAQIEAENRAAQAMLDRRAPMDPRGRPYISGVEHATRWVCHRAATPL